MAEPIRRPPERRVVWYSPYPPGIGCLFWLLIFLLLYLLIGWMWQPLWYYPRWW